MFPISNLQDNFDLDLFTIYNIQLIDEAGMKACSELPKLDLMKIASEIEIH